MKKIEKDRELLARRSLYLVNCKKKGGTNSKIHGSEYGHIILPNIFDEINPVVGIHKITATIPVLIPIWNSS